MVSFSSVDIFFFIRENKNKIIKQRIENIYSDNRNIYIKIYQKKEGNFFIKNRLGEYLYLDKNKEETQTPNPFIMKIRKIIKNSYITNITQINSERIIEINIEKKENKTQKEKIERYKIFIELFPPGNIILTDQENKIIATSLTKKFKDREIRTNLTYQLPEEKKINIYNEEIIENNFIKKNREKDIERFLIDECSLGKKYSKIIISELDIKEINLEKLKKITKYINEIKINAINIKEDGKIIDFLPFKPEKYINELKKKKDIEIIKKESFNSSIKEYFKENEIKKKDEKTKKYETEIKKLKNRLKKQENEKKRREEKIEELKKKGEYLYENYQIIEEILTQIKNKFEKDGYKNIKKEIKENPKLKFIEKINPEKKKIIINTEELEKIIQK